MIHISYPNVSHDKFLNVWGFILGPLSETGISESVPLDYRHKFDNLQNLPASIYHEKPVVHTEHNMSVRYLPVMKELVPFPSAEFPQQVKVPYWNNALVSYGLGYHEKTAVRLGMTSTVHELIMETSEGWTRYEVTVSGNGTRLGSVLLQDLRPLSKVSDTMYSCEISSLIYTHTLGGLVVSDCNRLLTADEILRYATLLMTSNQTTKTDYTQVQTLGWKQLLYSAISPQELVLRAEALFIPHERAHAQLLEKDFGELAVDASEKINATQINLLAFLRDMRHPQELIPKLRNLRNIKGLANTYLGVKYGILPTMSDLQNIVRAFERIKPHVERNGFKTYSAGYIKSEELEGTQATIEQHLKIAVDNEDNVFEALVERVESIGLLPTFQNLWDLVPYSFVLDWFIDVGDLLERIDTRLRLLRLNIRYTTMSVKRKTTQSLVLNPELPLIGELSLVRYHRWTSGLCPVPSLTFLNSRITDFNHWLESAALIIQRRKS